MCSLSALPTREHNLFIPDGATVIREDDKVIFMGIGQALDTLAVTMLEDSEAIGLVGTAATIGNIGPGFGEIGLMGSFGGLSIPTKIIFIINMIVGRLELIPFLAMLHPDFWNFRKSSY